MYRCKIDAVLLEELVLLDVRGTILEEKMLGMLEVFENTLSGNGAPASYTKMFSNDEEKVLCLENLPPLDGRLPDVLLCCLGLSSRMSLI